MTIKLLSISWLLNMIILRVNLNFIDQYILNFKLWVAFFSHQAYVITLKAWLESFGGIEDKERKRRFIGSIGIIVANLKVIEVWNLEASKILICSSG